VALIQPPEARESRHHVSAERAAIFISYARADDEAFVQRLHRDLEKRRLKVWWDRRAMNSRGRTFHQEIRDAIASVERVLLVLGPCAAASSYVRAEWQFAHNSCKVIVPILRLGDMSLLPESLSGYHCSDFRSGRPYRDAIEELTRILTEPIPNLAALHGVDALPPHFLSRPEELGRLRERILADVLNAREAPPSERTTALIGMGGTGKSVLAAALARSCDVRRAFPDGVVWIRLGRGRGVLAALRFLAEALGDDELQHVSDRHSGATRLHTLLDEKACLIVLDDVWDLDVAELFINALGVRCRQLITTRDRRMAVDLEAQAHELGVLSEVDALQLLADWVDQPVEKLPGQARQIARECGNLPLALAMIGALVQANPRRWNNALQKLQNKDLELIARRFPNYPHPSLLRAIEVSLDALDPTARQRYFDLAVFPEDTPIPEAAIEVLWGSAGASDTSAQDAVDLFVDRSLASRDERGHITLHDLQFDYIRRRARHVRRAHKRLVEGYRALCTGGWETAPDDGYCAGHLAYHLVKSRRKKELKGLLFDFGWLRVRLGRSHPSDLLSDFRLAGSGASLQLVEGALRLSAHVLATDPGQFATEMIGRLLGSKDRRVRALLRRIRRETEGTWLRPLIPCLTPPGGLLERTLSEASYNAPVALSPDGELAVAASDNVLAVWNLNTGKQLRVMDGHSADILAVSVCSDGRRAVSGSRDHTVRVWDLDSGETLRTLQGHSGEVHAVCLHPDGSRAISASSDGTVRLWNLKTGELLRTIAVDVRWRGLALWKGGKFIVSLSRGTGLKVWDLETGQLLKKVKGKRGVIYQTLNVAGRNLAVLSELNDTIRLLDLKSGRELKTLAGHRRDIYQVAVSANGCIAVSGSRDRTFRIWDLKKGKLLHTFIHNGRVRNVAITPDGRRAVSVARDRDLKVWNLASSGLNRHPKGHRSQVNHVSLSSDGRRALTGCEKSLLTGSEESFKFWDVNRGDVLGRKPSHAAALTPDAHRAAYWTPKGTIAVWDLKRDKKHSKLKTKLRWCKALLISKDGHCVVACSTEQVKDSRGDGRQAVSRTVSLLETWRLEDTTRCITKRASGDDLIVALSPDGRRIVLDSGKGRIEVIDVTSGAAIRTFQHGLADVQAIAVAADGKRVMLASRDALQVYELESGATLSNCAFDSAAYFKPILAPDAMCAATVAADANDAVHVHELTGDRFRVLEGHQDFIMSLALTPDARFLLSGSFDRTLRVWDVTRGAQVAIFTAESPIEECAISDDGRTIAAGERSGRVLFFRLEGGPPAP
jgi:WD40 repeat protein